MFWYIPLRVNFTVVKKKKWPCSSCVLHKRVLLLLLLKDMYEWTFFVLEFIPGWLKRSFDASFEVTTCRKDATKTTHSFVTEHVKYGFLRNLSLFPCPVEKRKKVLLKVWNGYWIFRTIPVSLHLHQFSHNVTQNPCGSLLKTFCSKMLPHPYTCGYGVKIVHVLANLMAQAVEPWRTAVKVLDWY